jgi:hypothetical protein
MELRAFPVLYANDVDRVAGFYVRLGFEEYFRMPSEDGKTGFVGLRRDHAELAVTTEASPRVLAGVEPGPGPRHELFVYVEDVDASLTDLRAAEPRSCESPPTCHGRADRLRARRGRQHRHACDARWLRRTDAGNARARGVRLAHPGRLRPKDERR